MIQGLLSPAEISALERHLDECEQCASMVVDLAGVLEPAVPEPPGAVIGRYRLLAPLSSGAMGAVYEAHDTELDRRVAIKRLRPDAKPEDREAASERLLAEARALARLQHPNVVAIHDVGYDGDDVYMVMELVDGRTMEEWVAAEAPSPIAIAAAFAQAARGLAAAHGSGVVHRDVKPANLLVGRDGRVQVVDFGLAGAVREAPIGGTPAYMAPEQLAGASADPSGDQYSLATSLHEALCGRVAARQRDFASLPASLRAAVIRASAADPKARYPSMNAFATALARSGRWAARWRVTALAVAVAAAAAAGFFALSRSRSPAKPIERVREAVQAPTVSPEDALSMEEHGLAMEFSREMDRADDLFRQRRGAECLEVLDGLPVEGDIPETWNRHVAYLRGTCAMQAGDCEQGRQRLDAWLTEESKTKRAERLELEVGRHCPWEDAEGAERIRRIGYQVGPPLQRGECEQAERLAREAARALGGFRSDGQASDVGSILEETAMCWVDSGNCAAGWKLYRYACEIKFAGGWTGMSPADLLDAATRTFCERHPQCAGEVE